MRLAGRFSRRIHGYAKANGIPVVHCPAGERKHELAEEYLAKTNITQGLLLMLVGRAQAPVWTPVIAVAAALAPNNDLRKYRASNQRRDSGQMHWTCI